MHISTLIMEEIHSSNVLITSNDIHGIKLQISLLIYDLPSKRGTNKVILCGLSFFVSFFLLVLPSPQRSYINLAHHPVQMTAPSRVMFLCSCVLMLLMPLLRLSCFTEIEDVVAVFIMLTTAPYFLFFCRCGIFHSMF